MKKLTLLTRLSAALAITIGAHSATAGAAQTNAVEFLNLQLTFFTQGPTVTNKPATNDISTSVIKTSVATKDVIGWLGTATTNDFPATAKLVRVVHLNAGGDTRTFEVRYGSNSVDVTPFFATSTNSILMLGKSIYNPVTGLSTGSLMENLYLRFTNAPDYNLLPFFHVSGSATVKYVAVKSGKTTLSADEISAPDVFGNGLGTNGVHALVTGSISSTGTTTEVK